jgi:hypothetical protein
MPTIAHCALLHLPAHPFSIDCFQEQTPDPRILHFVQRNGFTLRQSSYLPYRRKMSKPVKDFFKKVNQNIDIGKKLAGNYESGGRIVPSKTAKNDADYQLRIDAGELVDNRRNVVLQVNTQAKATPLKSWLRKNSSHGKLATASFDTAAKDQKAETARVLAELEKKAKDNL